MVHISFSNWKEVRINMEQFIFPLKESCNASSVQNNRDSAKKKEHQNSVFEMEFITFSTLGTILRELAD